jgi:protein N-terminal methyltransferase
LGGHGEIDEIDVEGSRLFISEYIYGKKGTSNGVISYPRISGEYACDCGAGIERVTKHFFKNV